MFSHFQERKGSDFSKKSADAPKAPMKQLSTKEVDEFLNSLSIRSHEQCQCGENFVHYKCYLRHLLLDCPDQLILCPNLCKTSIKRVKLAAHLASSC